MSKSSVLGEIREARIPAGSIRYRETGTGPTVLFLHGIVANGDLWRGVVPRLAGEYRCITPDWPLGSHEVAMGLGADFSLPGLAAMVGDFLAELGLDEVTLVANDTGGAIAQWVAISHPDRLARLVLTPCDAFENFLPPVLRHLQVFGRTPAGLWLLGQSLRLRTIQRLPIAFGRLTVREIDPEAMRSYVMPLGTYAGVRRDFAKLVRAISSKHTLRAAAELPGFDKPALIAWGLDDRVFPLNHGHRLCRLLPQGQLEVIEDAGAFVPEDAPERLAELVAGFVGGGRGKPSPT